MALTAERCDQFLSWAGKVKYGRPATPLDETELRLDLDKILLWRPR
jgi:hypothetical protein